MKLLFLLFALCASFKAEKTGSNRLSRSISGQWKNTLGSNMTITETSHQRPVDHLVGFYQTAVGDASGQYVLEGLIYPFIPGFHTQVFSFTVFWRNEEQTTKSVTAWTGIYYVKEQTLRTTWILTSDSPVFWNATLTGQDTFHRVN